MIIMMATVTSRAGSGMAVASALAGGRAWPLAGAGARSRRRARLPSPLAPVPPGVAVVAGRRDVEGVESRALTLDGACGHRRCCGNIAVMAAELLLDLSEPDPSVLHGQVRIRGTRVPVSVVLDCLAAGMTEVEIHEQYPTLPVDATRAALAYAAVLAREELYPLEPTSR